MSAIDYEDNYHHVARLEKHHRRTINHLQDEIAHLRRLLQYNREEVARLKKIIKGDIT